MLVSGAGGSFGSATVALGRRMAVLDDLRRRFGARVVPVRLTGDGDADTEAMKPGDPGP